jgi:hypothetical protein
MEELNKNGHAVEGWTYLNGKLISHDIKTMPSKWMSEKELFGTENISIGFINPAYIEVNEIQDKDDEYKKIKKFLNKYVEKYSKSKGVPIEDLSIEFINYGKTELVYVLSEKSGKRITLLVKQPGIQLGKVNQEAQNLLMLKKKDSNVVAPIDYFQLGDQELYATPYINQARCVASYGSWGMYIPEPYYRFEPFTTEQEKIVNSCMIAKLVSLYDFEKQEGISSCKLGGGDFMLPKGWEKEIPTLENTLCNLYLISAREKVKCSFEEYTSILRDEFSRATINEEQKELIINLRGRVPMQIADIESGIQLGQAIINNKKLSTCKQTVERANANNPTIKDDDFER